MTIISLASFKEAREKAARELIKFWRRQYYRYLGGRVHVAYKDYRCNQCIARIDQGDLYRRDVYANYKHIKVRRSHWPECYAPNEEDWGMMQAEAERQREEEQRTAIRKAA